jgi:small acid-soluble spore protein I (minor)
MNLDIRRHVKNNLSNASDTDVMSTINDALQIGEEKVLPGLGVLFELYWQHASPEEKTTVSQVIAKNIKQ